MALLVIAEIKLSDKELFDVMRFESMDSLPLSCPFCVPCQNHPQAVQYHPPQSSPPAVFR